MRLIKGCVEEDTVVRQVRRTLIYYRVAFPLSSQSLMLVTAHTRPLVWRVRVAQKRLKRPTAPPSRAGSCRLRRTCPCATIIYTLIKGLGLGGGARNLSPNPHNPQSWSEGCGAKRPRLVQTPSVGVPGTSTAEP